MSKLIFDDIKTIKALSTDKRLTVLKTKASGYSPFSEFTDEQPCDDDIFHLGDCPNLRSDIRSNGTDYTRLVLFSVVPPTNGNPPFIVFFIVKDSDGKWMFPTSRLRRNGSHILDSELLKLFHSSYNRLGFFEDTRYKLPYTVYEIESVANTMGEHCGNSLSCGMWVTANEILGKNVLGCDVCDSVTRFIAHTGEGVSRLYKTGKFIPGPNIYYARHDFAKSNVSGGAVVVGDLAYAIVKTFFVTETDGSSELPNVVLNPYETSGIIVRIAMWGCNGKSDGYELESVHTGEHYSYCVVRANPSSYCIMSSHSGSLTTDTLDAVEVLCGKMFIFE